jgi:hypothetical protein
MLRTFTAVLCVALASSAFVCSHKKREIHPSPICVVRADTLTLSTVTELVPGVIPDEQKVSRAALQCVLSEQAYEGSYQEKDKGFFSDLANQLSSQSGDAWTPKSSASLYWAAKAIKGKLREHSSVRAVAAYVDSLLATFVRRQDGGGPRQLLVNDSILAAMENAATRKDLEQALASVFRIPLTTAGVLVDFLLSEEIENSAVSDASSYIKGLVANKTAPLPSSVGPTAEELLKKTQKNLQLALKYRNQQSISDSIKQHLPDLSALYKKQLKLHQDLSGTVWVTFVISPNGSVSSAGIKSTDITEKEFINPFCKYVQKMHFLRIPENLGPMTFEFPFEFAPEQ